MKKLLLVLLLLFPVRAFAGVHWAVDCTPAEALILKAVVEADTDAVIEGVFPACTGGSAGHWGNSIGGPGYVNFVQPDTSTLMWIHGAGSLSVDGGGNATIICDEKTSNNDSIFIIKPNGTGGYFRVSGITFDQTGLSPCTGGANTTRSFGSLSVSGDYNDINTPQRFRVDHNTVIAHSHAMSTGGRVIGVFDHNVVSLDPGVAVFFNSWSDAQGDISWTEATALGSTNFPVFEDNVVTVGTNMEGKGTGGIEDSYRGSRFVIRFNDVDRAATQTHPTGGSGRARGTRAWEIYGNKHRNDGPNPMTTEFNHFFGSSGTGIHWGNDVVGTSVYDRLFTVHVNRRDGIPYDQDPPPDHWGFCGPKYGTGTVNTSGTAVTKTAGTNFATTWPANSRITINSIDYHVSSVGSTTALTLTTSAGSQSGVAYVVGSNWDGSTDTDTGYPCIDQLGRGIGDLLINDFGVTMENDATGGTYTSSTAYPRQALEPILIFKNIYVGGAHVDGDGSGAFLRDRDFYQLEDSAKFTSGTSPPGTCTEGDFYWDTDGGTWLTQTPEHGNATVENGKALRCGASNNWVTYYEPLAYPHPYIAATGGNGPPVGGGGTSNRIRLRIR